MNASFDVSNRPYADIIGNSKKYVVPVYQRDYSWGEEQWGDLWEELMEIQQQPAKDREQHYMGYLVLQQEEDGVTFRIIDGQQRLTTLSLLILAGLQILKSSDAEDDAKRAELIKRGFISVKSAVSLTESYKLQLNRNNDSYYRNDLASLSAHPAKGSIKATQQLMRKAKEFFEKRMREEKWNGEALGAFIETVVARYLFFTVISVGDEVNAYKVFETLNARGVKLSTPDLLKNHLFSVIDPNARDERLIQAQEEKWGEILERLGRENFSRFLRAFWNSREQLAKENQLFKKLRDSITAPSAAIGCLNDLREAAEVYAALRDKNNAMWREISDQKQREAVQECAHVLRIFNIVQPLPILLRARLTYSFGDFIKTCRYLTAFCARYHAVCSMPPQDMEKVYNKIAIAVAGGKQADFIKQTLLRHMPDDAHFHGNFKYKEMPRSRGSAQAAYLLGSIESALSASNPLPLENAYTIEHILPEKGSGDDDYWHDQFGYALEGSVNRLGNLTLLQAKDNHAAGCADFAAKKAVLGKSKLQIVQKLMQYDDWNPDSLSVYQHWLADQAVKIWKL